MGQASLERVGRLRAAEGAFESAVPLGVAGFALYRLGLILGAPATGRPYRGLELAVVLGGFAVISAWAAARQLVLFGRGSARLAAGSGAVAALLALATLRALAISGFEDHCADVLGGARVETAPLSPDEAPALACQTGGVQGNAYLPGTLVYPAWSGDLSLGLWLGCAAIGALAGIGLRDARLRLSRVPEKALEKLWLTPGAGLDSALGEPKAQGTAIVACGNPTLWGEVCGQIYSDRKVWAPGEWCVRCQQVFRRADRTLRFTVVSLFTADIDVLNGLERLDTLSWRQGEPMPPDARISGQERWVELGSVTLPDVLSVATALSLVFADLDRFAAEGDDAVKAAVALARARASRLCAWIWIGRFPHRLTYARPTHDVRFALGTAWLRDRVPEGGEELTLQLDLGLLPLEIRTGFQKTFLDERRAPEVQNSKVDLWIPVAPGGEGNGVWVDRVEGDALRAWLATERARAPETRGVSVPLPYRAHPSAETAPPASLDLVRMALDRDGTAPDGRRTPGDSISEWAWMDADLIELLRRQCLVQVDGEEAP